MKIQYLPPKVFRLDIDYTSIKRRANLNIPKIQLRYEFGIDNVPEKHIWIALRISFSVTEVESNNEVLGYLFKYMGIAFLEDAPKDLKDLNVFMQNAILNFQFYFEQNTPNGLFANQLIQNPDYDALAQGLMDNLLDSGVCYPQ